MENVSISHIVGRSQISNEIKYASENKDNYGLIYRRSFVNYTKSPIAVIDRNGIRFRVANVLNRKTGEFIIRTEYVVPKHSTEDIQRMFLYTEDHPDDYPELRLLRDAFSTWQSDRFAQKSFFVDTIIKESEFKDQKSIYVSNQDLVLTLEPIEKKVLHPFGRASLITERYAEMSQNFQGISMFVEIVDNDNLIGDRFMYTAKRVFKILALKDNRRESGIYLGLVEKYPDREPNVSSTRFDLEEGEEKLGLYRTQEEAISAGDVKSLREEEIIRLKHENSQLALTRTAEIETMNHNHELAMGALRERLLNIETINRDLDVKLEASKREREQDRSIHDLRIATLKSEYETIKMRDTQQYEKESSKIKIKHEIIKLGATAITSGLAVWLLLLKASANKDK